MPKADTVNTTKPPRARHAVNLGVAVLEAAASGAAPLAPAVAAALADVLRDVGAAATPMASSGRPRRPEDDRQGQLPLIGSGQDDAGDAARELPFAGHARPTSTAAGQADCDTWLSVAQVAAIFGTPEQTIHAAIGRCNLGHPWRGAILDIRRGFATRGTQWRWEIRKGSLPLKRAPSPMRFVTAAEVYGNEWFATRGIAADAHAATPARGVH